MIAQIAVEILALKCGGLFPDAISIDILKLIQRFTVIKAGLTCREGGQINLIMKRICRTRSGPL